METYAAVRSIPVNTSMRTAWAGLDALPSTSAIALAHVVDAFLLYENATRDAFAAGNATNLTPYTHPDLVEINDTQAHNSNNVPAFDWNLLAQGGVNVGPILGSRSLLLGSARELRDALSSWTPSTTPCDIVRLSPSGGAPYSITIDPTACATTYAQNDSSALIVDFAGNDIYHNNAGGNRLKVTGGCDEPLGGENVNLTMAGGRVAAGALLDFAGDDFHDGPLCGVNGGASLGAGLLVDSAGNDTYATAGPEANNRHNLTDPITGIAVNGGGHLGVGMLLDAAGNDHYWGNGSYAVNGGSLIGLGTLIDAGPSQDDYNATLGGVNGGANIGAAFLYDGGGEDSYNADARVANGGALMGAGVLIDLGGNDTYFAVNMSKPGRYSTGQNGGSRFGAALLFDGAGNDVYYGLRDGANGGGVDGVATLIDLSGNDYHNASYNGTIGAGWSLPPTSTGDLVSAVVEGTMDAGVGIGMLVDMGGDDVYHGGMFGTIGGAYIGASFFVDASGNDTYRSRDGGGAMGGVGGHSKGLGVGFLFDGGGDDRYAEEAWEIDPVTHSRPQSPNEGPGSIEFGGKGANGGGTNPGAVGLLVDSWGNDTYRGNSTAINGGAANAAVGMLIDGGGNDSYTAGDRGVNGGAYGGDKLGGALSGSQDAPAFGFLIDVSGNDKYTGGTMGFVNPDGTLDAAKSTTGRGVNGGGYLATGFLFDADGVDFYGANGTAVNGGGALGVGLLIDISRSFPLANDNYTANKTTMDPGSRYGANGGIVSSITCPRTCAKGSVGLLLDVAGVDRYYDDDFSGDTLNPYPARGYDKCIFPKYSAEAGAGQQRDVVSALYATAGSLAAACTNLP